MYCKNCGAEVKENSKFCSKCGADVRGIIQPNAVPNECEKESEPCTQAQPNTADVVGATETENKTEPQTIVAGEIVEPESEAEETDAAQVADADSTAEEANESAPEASTDETASGVNIDPFGTVWKKLTAKDTGKAEKNAYFANQLKLRVKRIIGNYKNFKNLSLFTKIQYITVPVLIVSILFGGGGGVKDSDYIGAAQTVVSKQLRSPATAQFSNEKVVEVDKYGRALVTLTVDATNAFGAYLRDNYAVVIINYNEKTDEFTWSRAAIVSWSSGEEYFSDMLIDQAKDASNWGEPLEEDDYAS